MDVKEPVKGNVVSRLMLTNVRIFFPVRHFEAPLKFNKDEEEHDTL